MQAIEANISGALGRCGSSELGAITDPNAADERERVDGYWQEKGFPAVLNGEGWTV